MMALCLSVCIASVLAGFYTKQSINIVFISIFPFLLLYSLYSHHRLNSFVVHAFYGIVITIAVSYILAGHFGFFEIWFRDHLSVRIFNIPLKNLLPLKTSVSNFDPVYISFAKSLYLEYVYNQPITFFTGIYMAILTYYRFLYLSRCSKLDLTLASWLLFGFVFLSIMKYHPDRYYLLISIPLIILSARFFVTRDYVNLVELTRKLKIQSFMFVIYLFWFYFVFYAGIVLFLNTIPFYVRKEWYNFIYFSFAKGRTADAIPLVAAVLLFQVIMFVLIVPRIKLLKEKLVSRKIFTTVFVILLVFDIFLHVKWLATSRNHLHELSVRIGEALPENSVLVGGWAPDLTLENGLRSLVIQGELNYNTGVVDTLVKGREVRVLEMKKGKKSEKYEGRMPVYLLISTNAPFEKKMRTVYRKYMKSANRIFSTEMGYFNVDMYRLDAPAGRERVLLKNYIDEYNRRNSSLWKKLIGVNLSDEERDKTEDISGQEPG
jgi:hypothetical protein